MTPNSGRELYIPIGCLWVDNIDNLFSTSTEVGVWFTFCHPEESQPVGPYLDSDVVKQLRQHRTIKPYIGLMNERWIKCSICLSPTRIACLVRVSFLPDDVERISVPRETAVLRKARAKLLSSLDYSETTWMGDFNSTPRASPNSKIGQTERETDKESTSLLRIFNEIPPPTPSPDKVSNLDNQDIMRGLLGCRIYGIKSTLYPYQGRSAALMVQKEVNPGRVKDPRLRQAYDHNHNTYFYDPYAGTILLESREYDGICGGILAEEMGAGKSLICIALIAATKGIPVKIPDIYRMNEPPIRPQVASLVDMAAAAVTRHSVAWPHYFEYHRVEQDLDYTACVEAIKRHPGSYIYRPYSSEIQTGWRLRSGSLRNSRLFSGADRKIYTSSTSIIVVPGHLLEQWLMEIEKHAEGISLLILNKKGDVPHSNKIAEYDIIMCSQTRFEQLEDEGDRTISGQLITPLSHVHFKRLIIDEGHRLGNSRIGSKSRLLEVAESIICSARWIVTGTPSDGLYGVDEPDTGDGGDKYCAELDHLNGQYVSLNRQEKKDLTKLGAMASLYLKVRPWANDSQNAIDGRADWNIYVMQKRHNNKALGDETVLRQALESIIIRHPLSQVKAMFPLVEERIVLLEGSYQDKLSRKPSLNCVISFHNLLT